METIPGCSGKETLERISWEEFFDGFEKTIWRFFIRTKQVMAGKPIFEAD
jgi:hypothetical protein